MKTILWFYVTEAIAGVLFDGLAFSLWLVFSRLTITTVKTIPIHFSACAPPSRPGEVAFEGCSALPIGPEAHRCTAEGRPSPQAQASLVTPCGFPWQSPCFSFVNCERKQLYFLTLTLWK